jgi:hypothetical protein
MQTTKAFTETLFDVDEEPMFDVDESNALVPLHRTKHQAVVDHSDHTHVELIDVRCDKDGMIVTVEFEQVFSGIIYSQGYFSDPKCRLIAYT